MVITGYFSRIIHSINGVLSFMTGISGQNCGTRTAASFAFRTCLFEVISIHKKNVLLNLTAIVHEFNGSFLAVENDHMAGLDHVAPDHFFRGTLGLSELATNPKQVISLVISVGV